MIGIEFEQHGIKNFLKCLFKNVDMSKYSFYLSEDEVYDNENIDFNGSRIENISNDFSQFLNKDYLIIFLIIQVYLKNEKNATINSYEDFLNSDCQLMVLITDVSYVEIYFKNDELKNQIIKSVEDLNIEYSIKTIDSDGRYTMHVN